jgi:hypothetical protein
LQIHPVDLPVVPRRPRTEIRVAALTEHPALEKFLKDCAKLEPIRSDSFGRTPDEIGHIPIAPDIILRPC